MESSSSKCKGKIALVILIDEHDVCDYLSGVIPLPTNTKENFKSLQLPEQIKIFSAKDFRTMQPQ